MSFEDNLRCVVKLRGGPGSKNNDELGYSFPYGVGLYKERLPVTERSNPFLELLKLKPTNRTRPIWSKFDGKKGAFIANVILEFSHNTGMLSGPQYMEEGGCGWKKNFKILLYYKVIF